MNPERSLTIEEKQSFYDDGYFVVKEAISQHAVDQAVSVLDKTSKPFQEAGNPALTGLVSDSAITPVLHDLMGDFDPPKLCQVGVNPRRSPGDHFNNLGYLDKEQPYFGCEMHIDGSLTIRVPQERQDLSESETYEQYIANGPRGNLGRSPDVVGHNLTPLFQDPEMTLGLGSFTAFVFVCLNDQTIEGRGQTALLKGAHHEVERFFRKQRDLNNHLGVEGPGWPRLNFNAPNGCGLVYVPEEVRQVFIDESSEETPDGNKWPRPTQILMEPGDACIAMYHIPHSATRNELGSESRKSIIFRIRNKSRQPDKVVTGISDHPDRGWNGEWLSYEPGNNPWERSKYAMCNMWHEWEGMKDVVELNRKAMVNTTS